MDMSSASPSGALHEHLLALLDMSLAPRERQRRGEQLAREITSGAAAELRVRRAHEILVRAHNPSGLRSGRTALEVALADGPFLVDTFRLALRRRGLREMLLVHPVLRIERSAEGEATRIGEPDSPLEAFLYAEVPLVKDAEERSEIEAELREVFAEARATVVDYPRMVRAIRNHTAEIEFYGPQLPDPGRGPRAMNLLSWLADDNFVFQGYRRYRVARDGDDWSYAADAGSGLGILRGEDDSRFAEPVASRDLPDDIRSHLEDERIVFFDKSRRDSRVHRNGRLDTITIKMLDDDGRPVGMGKIVGLLTYNAIRARASEIPVISHRRHQVLDGIGAQPGSHTHKAAIEALDSLPVEFLFSFDVGEITTAVEHIIRAIERQQVEVYTACDPFSRAYFVSAILPRPSYDETLRVDLERLLVSRYRATYIDHRSTFVDDSAALIHFFCSSSTDIEASMLPELEEAVGARVARWRDRFETALLKEYPPERAYALADQYADALPESYRVVTEADDAVGDVECLETVRTEPARVELTFSRDTDLEPGGLPVATRRLKLFCVARPYLTDLLPLLGHFGLRVVDATLTEVPRVASDPLWIVTFRIEEFGADRAGDRNTEERILSALDAVLQGRMEGDPLNVLVLGAALEWRDVDWLRAHLAYGRQLGTGPELGFAAETLLRYPGATQSLVRLLRARFDPGLERDRGQEGARARAELENRRESIPTSAEDRVFAGLENTISAMLRANYDPALDQDVHEIAFKIDTTRVEGAPRPMPFVEIFVHSAEMNGVHLRGGPVARGGLRWSDRPQDFRSEILGLMKTQMVKNGLIVPVGSKGGFVLKRRYVDADERRQQADRLYARFVRLLLQLTDDLRGDDVVPPDRIVRYDGDDPYLVVAADKGTAHLSDVANAVAEEEGFWLGDAFASGGSEGYDHKREGITARGAWICVKRHFLELGTDVERDTFTFAGVGDMSGDVFGNGALLARRGQLVAAFNHQHVFLDPDPDPEVAWAERKRLFERSRSSWRDYDPGKLSAGGGVFDRNARSIPLSERIVERLGLDPSTQQMAGEELVRAILLMPVDLLWFGGIGTYAKGSSESDADVGDRANDSVRVNAAEIRARVVGEGANLGLTQLARVEYALAGGRINTDAIDNCAGVNLSDHEVNFKILAGVAERDGSLSRADREDLLRGCVEEACDAVLRDSTSQSRCLSLEEMRVAEDPDCFLQSAVYLSRTAGLDWKLEFLPEREELRARAASSSGPRGYTRPELSTLLGYMKMWVKRSLIESELLDSPVLEPLFTSYFPGALLERLPGAIDAHRLRREVTASCLCNFAIDQSGVGFVPELSAAAGASAAQVVGVYYTADQLLEAGGLRERIAAASISESQRLRAALRLEGVVRAAACGWIALEENPCPDRDLLSEHRAALSRVRELLPTALRGGEAERVRRADAELAELGLEPGVVAELARLPALVRSFGAVSIAVSTGVELERALDVHAAVGETTRIAWVLDRVERLRHADGWDRVAAVALHMEMLCVQRTLTGRALESASPTEPLAPMRRAFGHVLQRIDETAQHIEADDHGDLAPLAVLSQQIRRLC